MSTIANRLLSTTSVFTRQAGHQCIPLSKKFSTRSYPPLSVPQNLMLAIAGYFTLVNVGAYGLFYYDKYQASTKGWRVKESDLQLSALAGGWIGGTLAMQHFRHKTIKKAFQQPYLIAVGMNIVACVGAVAAWIRVPAVRKTAYTLFRESQRR